MVDKKYKDFDAAVSEADGEKVTFKILKNILKFTQNRFKVIKNYKMHKQIFKKSLKPSISYNLNHTVKLLKSNFFITNKDSDLYLLHLK